MNHYAVDLQPPGEIKQEYGSDPFLADASVSVKSERRLRCAEIWIAVAKRSGVQLDSILID